MSAKTPPTLLEALWRQGDHVLVSVDGHEAQPLLALAERLVGGPALDLRDAAAHTPDAWRAALISREPALVYLPAAPDANTLAVLRAAMRQRPRHVPLVAVVFGGHAVPAALSRCFSAVLAAPRALAAQGALAGGAP
jgi:hypothetical protein